MKKANWIYLVLMAFFLLLLFGYRTFDGMSEDKKAPKINISEEQLSLSVTDPEEILLQGVTAEDKRDGDVSHSVIVESIKLKDPTGVAGVSYAAFDNAGNVAKATREVLFTDYQSPRFSLSKPLAFPQGSNFDVLDIVGAYDTLDGDIKHRIRVTPLDDSAITALGEHQVEFRVTNSLGDTVRLTLPVEVYSSGAYKATMALDSYLVYMEKGEEFDPEEHLDSFTYAGDTTYLRQSIPSGFTYTAVGEVDTNTPGVYTVDYKVTNSYAYGSSVTAYSKLIVIVEG